MIDIFEHPSWGPTSMQIWVGGQNFSFPTLFDSYRELLLSLGTVSDFPAANMVLKGLLN